jgi:acetoin utilization protein AcuB
MTAADVMTPDPITLTAEASLDEAAQLMRERGIRHVPVVDAQGGLVGMLSDRDLAIAGPGSIVADEVDATLGERLATPIVKAMTAEVIAVEPETELGEIVDAMLEQRVGAIPVLDGPSRRVIGIVSYVDVLRALRELIDEV